MIGTRAFVTPAVAQSLIAVSEGRIVACDFSEDSPFPNADVAMAFGAYAGIGAEWIEGQFTTDELRVARDSTRAIFPRLAKELRSRGQGHSVAVYETYTK